MSELCSSSNGTFASFFSNLATLVPFEMCFLFWINILSNFSEVKHAKIVKTKMADKRFYDVI